MSDLDHLGHAKLSTVPTSECSSSAEEHITLISQCGKKFFINKDLAVSSSEYFSGAFEAGLIESGKLLQVKANIFCAMLLGTRLIWSRGFFYAP